VTSNGDVLTDARAELRAAPPDAFVDTRKELASRLAAGGHRSEAAELRKERRPQLGAWGVNQLVDVAAQELVDLVDVSDRLAALLGDRLDGEAAVELREAMRERQLLLQELADRADAAMRAIGHPGHRDEMLATIDAASMDEEHRAELLDGRLAKVLPPPARFGPGVLGGGDEPARAPRGEPALATVTELPRRGDAARVRRVDERAEARAAQRIARATETVDRRRAEAEEAQAARESAAEVREAAASRVSRLEADLADARDELRRADRAFERARAKEEQAAEKLADAERTLEEAEASS